MLLIENTKLALIIYFNEFLIDDAWEENIALAEVLVQFPASHGDLQSSPNSSSREFNSIF